MPSSSTRCWISHSGESRGGTLKKDLLRGARPGGCGRRATAFYKRDDAWSGWSKPVFKSPASATTRGGREEALSGHHRESRMSAIWLTTLASGATLGVYESG